MADRPKTYAVFLDRGPNYEALSDHEDEHVDYIETLIADRRILMGGPFDDGSSAMYVMLAVTRETASELAESDPYVRSGVYRATVRRWRLVGVIPALIPPQAVMEGPEGAS